MFSQLFVQIFALYNFFRKNLRKKRRKFSMDPIWGGNRNSCRRIICFCFAFVIVYLSVFVCPHHEHVDKQPSLIYDKWTIIPYGGSSVCGRLLYILPTSLALLYSIPTLARLASEINICQ